MKPLMGRVPAQREASGRDPSFLIVVRGSGW